MMAVALAPATRTDNQAAQHAPRPAGLLEFEHLLVAGGNGLPLDAAPPGATPLPGPVEADQSAAESQAAALIAQIVPAPPVEVEGREVAVTQPPSITEPEPELRPAGEDEPEADQPADGVATVAIPAEVPKGAGTDLQLVAVTASPQAAIPPANTTPPTRPVPTDASQALAPVLTTGRPAGSALRSGPADPSRRAPAASTSFEPASDAQPSSGSAAPHPFAAMLGAPVTLDTVSADPIRLAAAPVDLTVDRQLDLAQDHAWLDRLAQDIALSAGEASRIRFALSPEHLGRLTVDIANGADGTAVRLTTESEQAQRILSDAQPRLVAEARAQGLRLIETSVDLGQRSGGQQHSGTVPDQAAMAGSGGRGGDRPRGSPDQAHIDRMASEVTTDINVVARDLYA